LKEVERVLGGRKRIEIWKGENIIEVTEMFEIDYRVS